MDDELPEPEGQSKPERVETPSPAPEFTPIATTPAAPVPLDTAVAPLPPLAVSAVQPSFRDRSTGLTIFGIFQIILGLMAALMIPLAVLGLFLSRLGPGGAMRPGQVISSLATYAFASAFLITLGVGSMRMRRWAYALTLVTSWYWLVMGVLITILMTAVMPFTMRSAFADAQLRTGAPPPTDFPTGLMAVIITMVIVFAAVFCIAVPVAFVIFYSRKDVAETCRQRDPVARWTDRAPLPVLGASVVMFVSSLYLFVIGIATPLFPFFGRYLYGISGASCYLAIAVVDIFLAIGIFRLRSWGWWVAVLLAPIRLLSVALTFARADLMEAYSKMGLSEEQLRMLNANPMMRAHVIQWWGLVSAVIFFAYLLWLKRYFKAPALPGQAVPVPESMG